MRLLDERRRREPAGGGALRASDPRAPFVLAVRLGREPRDYAAGIPGVRGLGRLELDPHVTFLVGDNGSGKSTLVEGIAVAAKFNPEGGGKQLRFATRASHSELSEALELEWAPIRPANGFFLRAESFFNFATAAEGSPIEQALYDSSLHERSHGESFLELVLTRFGPGGLYILDEPEAALSARGQLALMRRMHELVEAHSQFIVATHSPILVGYPHATIYELTDDGIERRDYEEIDQVGLTRAFLADRERFLHHLLSE